MLGSPKQSKNQQAKLRQFAYTTNITTVPSPAARLPPLSPRQESDPIECPAQNLAEIIKLNKGGVEALSPRTLKAVGSQKTYKLKIQKQS